MGNGQQDINVHVVHRGVQPMRSSTNLENLKNRKFSVSRLESRGSLLSTDTLATASQFQISKRHALYNYDRMHSKLILLPNSLFRRIWDILVALFVMYISVKVPLSVCFPDYWEKNFYTFDTFLDVFFVVDIVLTFRTGYIHNGHIETDSRKIAEHYVKGWCILDVLACFPWHNVINVEKKEKQAIKIAKALKMSKLLRIGRIVRYLKQYFKFRHLMLYIVSLLFMTHLMTCLWFAVSSPPETELYMLVYNKTIPMDVVYWSSFHGVFSQMLGLKGTVPDYIEEDYIEGSPEETRVEEHWLSILLSLIGIFVVSILTTVFVLLLQSYGNSYENFQRHLATVRAEMIRLAVSEPLQKKVNAYYQYLWLNQKPQVHGGFNLLNDSGLSASLRKDVCIELAYGKLPISRVKAFASCSDDCLAALVSRMRSQIYMPRDILFNEGDLGRELFYLLSGSIVLLRNGKSANITLQSGAFFGEVAVLCNGRRMLSAQAVTFCDMQVLEKEDLELVFSDFPEYRSLLQNIAMEHLKTDRRKTVEAGHAFAHEGLEMALRKQQGKERGRKNKSDADVRKKSMAATDIAMADHALAAQKRSTMHKAATRGVVGLQTLSDSSSDDDNGLGFTRGDTHAAPLTFQAPVKGDRDSTMQVDKKLMMQVGCARVSEDVTISGTIYNELSSVIRVQAKSLGELDERCLDIETRMANLGSVVKQLPVMLQQRSY